MEGGSGPLPMSIGIAILRNVMQKYMYVLYMHMYVYMQFKFSLEDAVQRDTKEHLYPSSLLFLPRNGYRQSHRLSLCVFILKELTTEEYESVAC